MKRYIKILESDSTMLINLDTNYFSRARNGEFFVDESSTWICVGAVILNNFGNIVERMNLAGLYFELKSNPAKMFYKNGKAKFRITDIDHGTHRIQMNPVLTKNNVFICEEK